MEDHLLRNKIFHLAHCRGVGPITQIRMLTALLDDPGLSAAQLAIKAALSSKNTAIFFNSYAAIQLEAVMERYKKEHIHWLTILDNRYPEYLRQIYNPPVVLFYQGNLALLEQKLLAVVGARKNTAYGLFVLDQLLPELIENDFVLVSGLAKGIDYAVHQKTISKKGKTIAVVGTGLDLAYPFEHKALQAEIGRDHLLLSEYPIGEKPLKQHFPMRNRIIAGLSVGTLVVEAQSRSGSLITANLALQEGREVFAVPGAITNPYSTGTNELILHGAKCVLTAEHILEELSY
ncbi:DNA-processing protein DprA [Carnobacterium mobile]|uniref:DNA-processing protein DprA n=1 Tax=Carnobacterium mobile TaxID=2750 RepID=UPI0018683180|nr:DNA-processing protein DprA [Carnobacterium mobile]